MKKEDFENIMVSVIITTCRREPAFVIRALNSVIDQTYPNLEIIVVDDSPKDYTEKKNVQLAVENYEYKIKYISCEDNKGAPAARNNGINAALGEYIAFLDDDDEWLPEKIERQLDGFKENNVAMVYCDAYLVDDAHNINWSNTKGKHSGWIYDKLLEANFIGSTSIPLIKRKCLVNIGGFDETMRARQDYELFLRIAKNYEIKHISGAYVVYHIHEGVRISSIPQDRISGGERLIEKYRDELIRNPKAWAQNHRVIIDDYRRSGRIIHALKIWISAAFRDPFSISLNFQYFFIALFSSDSYIITLYRKLLYGRKRGKNSFRMI